MVACLSTFVTISVFFNRALQWMLMLTCEIHRLRYFGLCDLVRVNPANPDTPLVNVQHDLGRILLRTIEETFQDVNNKLHRGVVVVQHQYFVHGWSFGSLTRFEDDSDVFITIDIWWTNWFLWISHSAFRDFLKLRFYQLL